MNTRVKQGGLQISKALYDFIVEQAIPGTNLSADEFWKGLEKIIDRLSQRNTALLAKRDHIQQQIDNWHCENKGKFDAAKYKEFLTEIGYILQEGDDFKITTVNVDEEISLISAPQLVVPVSNARFALNAANARWGSLYDALYGTDVIEETNGLEKGSGYNPRRGEQVVSLAIEFLDEIVPLAQGSHADVVEYKIIYDNNINSLVPVLSNGIVTKLSDPNKFVGYRKNNGLTSILLKNNDLHIDIQIDRNHPTGQLSPSGVSDIQLESAVTTIQDCEDSVAAVDVDDKVAVYRNWLGLMKGTLNETFEKAGKSITRKLNRDREYSAPDGNIFRLPGRSLMLIRNVGHHMFTDAVLDKDGKDIPEGILDAMVTTLCAMHDLMKSGHNRNSRTGSIYVVKPKMHGPEEVAFTNELFSYVEDALGLPRNTIKVGVMDEERRTTINLKECIRSVRERIVFINTGFLDRTGDEIHTSMEAGAVLPKEIIKDAPWLVAYENWNVDIGIECGLPGRAQIGKGMWAKPDLMRLMLATKQAHPESGANCAWVPSPTAATLHAIHYHKVNVFQVQNQLAERKRASLDVILSSPLLGDIPLTEQEIQSELDNNVQGILGYVVRWVNQGIGCSKVPNIQNVGLMEDRATLRISSQHIANWLHQGICSHERVMATLKRMAEVVDRQNSDNGEYVPMTPDVDKSAAFQAACDLIFKGRSLPNGYTESVLHMWRRKVKAGV